MGIQRLLERIDRVEQLEKIRSRIGKPIAQANHPKHLGKPPGVGNEPDAQGLNEQRPHHHKGQHIIGPRLRDPNPRRIRPRHQRETQRQYPH